GVEVQARPGFTVIATANDRDRGVNEPSSALRRRFNTVVLPLPATAEEEVDIVTRRVADMGRSLRLPEVPAGLEEIRRVVTVFRELRQGATEDGRAAVASPSGTLSTAEAVSVLTHGLAMAAHFGDGVLRPSDVAAGVHGAVVQDPAAYGGGSREDLGPGARTGPGWRDSDAACREGAGWRPGVPARPPGRAGRGGSALPPRGRLAPPGSHPPPVPGHGRPGAPSPVDGTGAPAHAARARRAERPPRPRRGSRIHLLQSGAPAPTAARPSGTPRTVSGRPLGPGPRQPRRSVSGLRQDRPLARPGGRGRSPRPRRASRVGLTWGRTARFTR